MTLQTLLKNNENARKIFGKRELKIIEKQLLGINLSQSEKNRLSRDIRPKLEFIKECARFENSFKLKKGAIIKEKINTAKNIILQSRFKDQIKKIILYGSTIQNDLTFRSDIDIAISLKKISLKEATKIRIELLGILPSKIDLQILETLPEKIKKEIKTNNKILYTNEDKRKD